MYLLTVRERMACERKCDFQQCLQTTNHKQFNFFFSITVDYCKLRRVLFSCTYYIHKLHVENVTENLAIRVLISHTHNSYRAYLIY